MPLRKLDLARVPFPNVDNAPSNAICRKLGFELLYPGSEHLFADPSLPEHDADAAALLTERVLAFLHSIDAGDTPVSDQA